MAVPSRKLLNGNVDGRTTMHTPCEKVFVFSHSARNERSPQCQWHQTLLSVTFVDGPETQMYLFMAVEL